MKLRLPNQVLVIALVAGCPAVWLSAQGSRQQSYKLLTPLAGVGSHSRDASPLGRVDGGVNQSIELGATVQFDGGVPTAPGLDQIQSSRPAGQRSPLSVLSTTINKGAPQKPASEAYKRPSYAGDALRMGHPMIVGPAQILRPKKQSDWIGERSKPSNTQVSAKAGIGKIEAAKRAGGLKRARGQLSEYDLALTNPSQTADANASGVEEAGQNKFERLQDPFLAPSTAGFEGFRKRSYFELACGDACSLRPNVSSDETNGELRRRRSPVEMPDAKAPATKGVFGQEPGLPTEPSAGSPPSPY